MPEKENTKLKALIDIASINITSDFDDILKNIIKITCESMNAHSGTIMLRDEETDEIRMAAHYGLPEDYIERVYRAANEAGVRLSSSPSGTVLKTGNYYSVPNIFKEQKDKPWWELSKRLGFSSQLFTPIKSGMYIIGLLNIYMSDVHHFTEEEINFVGLAAHQAFSVVHNSRMCHQIEKNKTELNERKKLELILKASEEKYRKLFEGAQDAIYVTDQDCNFLNLNDYAAGVLGDKRENVIGTNLSQWVTPDSLKKLNNRRIDFKSGKYVNPIEIFEIICKNGAHKWVEVRSKFLKLDDGKMEIHGIARDVTETALLKQRLNKSTAQQKVLKHLIRDSRGGKTRTFILKYICDKSYNAHQLATALNMDYKTIRHHLNVLIKNGIVGKSNDGSYDLYFILSNTDLNLNE